MFLYNLVYDKIMRQHLFSRSIRTNSSPDVIQRKGRLRKMTCEIRIDKDISSKVLPEIGRDSFLALLTPFI